LTQRFDTLVVGQALSAFGKLVESERLRVVAGGER